MLLNEGKDSFLEEEISFKDAKYVIIPVPLDITTTYLKGTKFGPRSIIEASRSLENYDFEFNYQVKNKVFTLNELDLNGDIRDAMEAVNLSVSDIRMEGKIPILLGGEHTITYGASLSFDKDTVFVIFDAHADFKTDYLGLEINHASSTRLVNMKNNVIIVGVRSLSIEEKEEINKRGIFVIYINEIENKDSMEKLISKITGKDLYISIDMDVFDPSIAPGVGTPQPNGINYRQFIAFIKGMIKSSSLKGFDITETRPLDNNVTEILAAKIITDIISVNEIKAGDS